MPRFLLCRGFFVLSWLFYFAVTLMGHHPDSFCECQTRTPSFPPTTHLSKILDALNQENNVSKTLASLQSNEWQNSKNTTTNCLWYLLLYWIRNVWNRINCLLKILHQTIWILVRLGSIFLKNDKAKNNNNLLFEGLQNILLN